MAQEFETLSTSPIVPFPFSRRPAALAALWLLLCSALGGSIQAQVFPETLSLGDLEGTRGFRIDGASSGDRSGESISAAGDVNGDGIDDLIIGARFADAGASDTGSSFVVFGNQAGFAPSLDLGQLDGSDGFRINGIVTNDQSGGSVSAAGDINGDGIDDLVIGAAGANGEAGVTYVVFGSNTGFPPTLSLSALDGSNGFRLDGVNAGDASGRAVSTAGDVNADGIDDLVIGAFLAGPDGNPEAGSSYVVFGRDTAFPAALNLSSLDGTTGFRIDGVAAGERSGRALSDAGDVNGDGIDDLIIGAHRAEPDGNDGAGSSYVVFGRDTAFPATLSASSLDGTTGFRIDAAAVGEISGHSVSRAGDVNDDGIEDLVIGAPRAAVNGNPEAGKSYVVFGRSTGFGATLDLSALDGNTGFRIDGTAAADHAGWSVSRAGDLDDDGIDDLIIGARFADPDGNDEAGMSYVVFGRSTGFPATLSLSGLDGTIGFRLPGVADSDLSGSAVSHAGDINSDGINDVIIGAQNADPNGRNMSGSSYVVFGRGDFMFSDRFEF